jgi:hypothetical protein
MTRTGGDLASDSMNQIDEVGPKRLGELTERIIERFRASRASLHAQLGDTTPGPSASAGAPDKQPPPIELERPWPVASGPAHVDQISPSLRAALKEAITAQRWPILMFGPPGTGKTCAAACVYRIWRWCAVWHECSELLADVMACRASGSGSIWQSGRVSPYEETEVSIKRKFAEASLCVLNDLGLREPTEAQYEVLVSLFDSRLAKPLIITSNLGPAELEEIFDARLVSRIARGTVINVTGPDRRAVGAKFVRVEARV